MAENTFEELMHELETIVSKLQGSNIELNNALELFEKGIALSKDIREILDKAEQKVTKLTAENEPKEEPFDSASE